MSDYISRTELSKLALAVPIANILPTDNIMYRKVVFWDDVDAFPSVDVVKVVRCADCKWFQCNKRMDGTLPKGVPEYECRCWCGYCAPIDYCSYGMRER